MAQHIPFNSVTFRPTVFKDNDTSPQPVEFELSQVDSAEQLRLKGMLFALASLAAAGVRDPKTGLVPVPWTPELEQASTAALRAGRTVFEQGVDAVRNLTVPARLAVKAGILASLPENLPADQAVPIATGEHFGKVAAFLPTLAFEVAQKIADLCDEGYIDPRFFEPRSISPGTPVAPNGSARPARHRPGRTATAAGDRRKAAARAAASS